MSDNPSAFPHDLLRDDDAYPTHDAWPGMSLRDWFAGQALAGCGTWSPNEPNGTAAKDPMKSRAKWAYSVADAMLAARTGDA